MLNLNQVLLVAAVSPRIAGGGSSSLPISEADGKTAASCIWGRVAGQLITIYQQSR